MYITEEDLVSQHIKQRCSGSSGSATAQANGSRYGHYLAHSAAATQPALSIVFWLFLKQCYNDESHCKYRVDYGESSNIAFAFSSQIYCARSTDG
jgi:hypothetical protein